MSKKSIAFAQFSRLRWLLIPVIALHNFEEWLTFPIYGETGSIIVAKFGIFRPEISWSALQLALILVTILPAIVIVWASRRNDRLGDWLISATGSIFLANVFLPHFPAAVIVGGYSPGLATAALVNLPFISLLLLAVRRERRLTLSQLLGSILTGLFMLPISLFAVLMTARAILP